jgi:G3E family GTPase
VPIPVQIFAGFLGAGKTTAIGAQLAARPGERVAVIVNDFGEASLDEVTLDASEPFRITNIPGGCVCCTAPEGFVEALGAVLEEKPDRLLIEPTGLARPQDLIDTIRRCPHANLLEMAPVVVLLDPRSLSGKGSGDAATRRLLQEQAQVADVLVANRSDLCDEADLEAFQRFAAEIWPPPLAVHVTRQGALPGDLLDWPEGEGSRAAREMSGPGHDHTDSTAGYRSRSWKWSPEVVFSRQRLSRALLRLAAGEEGAPLARFKGIFRTEEGTSRLEISGGILHDRLTSYRRDSRADAIVRAEDDEALARIGEWLEGAVLRDEERRRDANRVEVVLPDGRVHGVDLEVLRELPDPIPDVSPQFPGRAGSAARLSSLFAHLELPSRGQAVVVAGDGFASEPVDLDVLLQGVLLHSLEGEPLPASKGGPFRLLIPEAASAEPVSCANVKGVAKLVLRSEDVGDGDVG